METRYRTVHRRKRRTLKSVWGALAGLSFLLMLGTGGHRRDAAGAVQNGTQPRERETGERYMVVLASLSVWQRLHVFLRCQQQRQRQLRRRERCAWRGLRLLPLI